MAMASPQLAWHCYLASALQGYSEAQCRLGLLSASDPKASFEWFAKAAAQGQALAQYHVGHCYEHGIGIQAVSCSEAVRWYQAAAVQGVPAAQMALGACYRQGKGVAEDLNEAVRWYKEAEKNGMVEAGVVIAQIGAMLTV